MSAARWSVIVCAASAVVLSIAVFSLASVSAAETSAPRPGSVYIPMPDGTRLAADLWWPPESALQTKVPAVVSFTRYWRSRSFDPAQRDADPVIDAMTAAGAVVVIIDARGSGASFGRRDTEFSTCEVRDFKPVVDWIAAQAWSNGRVATYGESYSGNTAEAAAIAPSSALVAAVALFTDFDAYSSILFPGGLRNAFISGVWGAGVLALDRNEVPQGEWRSGKSTGPRLLGVQPVQGDTDGQQLKAAVAQHHSNLDVSRWLMNAEFRDDLKFAAALSARCDHMVAPYQFLQRPTRRSLPMLHWGSWMDAGTAAGVLARFVGDPGAGEYVIGAWSHGAAFDADIFAPADTPVAPNVPAQIQGVIDYLQPFLNASAVVRSSLPVLRYYTMGEKRWKQTEQWPPKGTADQVWYLGPDQRLLGVGPTRAGGTDVYKIDYSARSGRNSRWATQVGGPDVIYADRGLADQKLLTYTSAPLAVDTEITGHPSVTLQVSSTHPDGAIIVYLEAVSPQGAVQMITEGELRLIHRRVSSAPSPYPTFGAYHTFNRQDAMPLRPGEIAEIAITLLPTSVRIPQGFSLRLAIAGHDQDAFHRYPMRGFPTIKIHREQAFVSSLTVPVVAPAAGHGAIE